MRVLISLTAPLTPIAGAGQRLLTRMNTDVLPFTEAKTTVLARTLRRLGSLEFCEEDCQQLQLWASQRQVARAAQDTFAGCF